MIFKSIIYTKPYSIEGFGTYMQEKAQVEIILEEGDTVQSAFIEAERQLDEWHKEKTSKPSGSFVNFGADFIPPKEEKPKEYNLQDEQTEIAIDNATTLEELAALKPDLPSRLVSHYMKRLKELK